MLRCFVSALSRVYLSTNTIRGDKCNIANPKEVKQVHEHNQSFLRSFSTSVFEISSRHQLQVTMLSKSPTAEQEPQRFYNPIRKHPGMSDRVQNIQHKVHCVSSPPCAHQSGLGQCACAISPNLRRDPPWIDCDGTDGRSNG